MRRVWQVTPYYPPHLGGMEVVVAELSAALSRRGFAVEVVTTTCGSLGAPRRAEVDGVRIRRHLGLEAAHTPIAPGMLLSLFKAGPTDIVHVHLAHALIGEMTWLAAALKGRPYIVHFHLDVDASGSLGWLLPAYKRQILGRILRAAQAVIVLSSAQREFLTMTYRVSAEQVRVLPNGVGQEFIDLGLAREQQGEPAVQGPFRLLYFGRLSAQKNTPRLLAAMALLAAQEVSLTIVGDGEDRPQLERMVENMGLTNVKLVGPQYGHELRRTISNAQAFVLPSDREGMPLVVLEAMAAGLPVIATDVAGTRELVRDIGLLTPPTAAGLAAGISELASEPVRQRQCARAGWAKARNHSWSQAAEQLDQIYREAVPEAGARQPRLVRP